MDGGTRAVPGGVDDRPRLLADVYAVEAEIARRTPAHDSELASVAAEKRRAGARPNGHERAAASRCHAVSADVWREYICRSVPQKSWREWSGRQAKILREQEVRTGIPFGRASIDVAAVARALHDFLARNKFRLSAPDCDDPLLAGASSPALEQYRRHKSRLAELDVAERESELLPRERMHEFFARVTHGLRQAGEQLQREHGQSAADIVDEALDELERSVDEFFGDDSGK